MTFYTQPAGDPSAAPTEGQPSQQPTNQDQGSQDTDNGYTPEQIAELVKRDANAQQHISNIENENRGMREDLQKLQEQMQDYEAKLAAQRKVEELLKGSNTSNQQGDQHMEQQQQQTPAVNKDDINALVNEQVKNFFTEREKEENFNRASSAVTEIFKDKADSHVTKVAEENGMSFEEAQSLAREKPQLFNNLFVKPFTSSQGKGFQPTESSQNTGSVSGNNEITQEYWNKMRRENSAKYWSVPVQKQYYDWVLNQNK